MVLNYFGSDVLLIISFIWSHPSRTMNSGVVLIDEQPGIGVSGTCSAQCPFDIVRPASSLIPIAVAIGRGGAIKICHHLIDHVPGLNPAAIARHHLGDIILQPGAHI